MKTVAELKAELKRREKLGNMHDSKGNYRGADYHFAFIAGIRFALKKKRSRSATAKSSDPREGGRA